MALIACRGAAFAYDGGLVVRDLDFEVHAGNYLCVVGENGSGKSTLIKGLLQLKAPKQGSVALGDGLRVNEIGYLPQQSPAQKDFPASAFEVALSGRLNRRGLRPFYSARDKHAALDNLRRLGIEDLKNRCYRELSGGQQRRVLLARALCATKKLLLLDEPVAGLDPPVARELYRQLAGLNRTEGLTVVMVSHDLDGILDDATHILHLQNQQVFFGTAEEYKESSVARDFFRGDTHD